MVDCGPLPHGGQWIWKLVVVNCCPGRSSVTKSVNVGCRIIIK